MKEQNKCLWEKKGEIGILKLNNPPENYVDDPEFIGKDLIAEILSDSFLKGIIITGTGRHFSAGADLVKLRLLAKDEALLHKKISAGKDLIRIIEELNIPVIAAVRGVCFGAGLEIALACHIRICSENALFAFPEANHGIIPGLGGTVMLTKLVGPGRSSEIILTSEIVNSDKALEIKLADYVVPVNELMAFSSDLLGRMTADREIDIIKSVMKSIHNSQSMSFEKALQEETRLFCSLAIKAVKDIN